MGGEDSLFDYGILQQVTIMAAIFSLIGLGQSRLATGSVEDVKRSRLCLNSAALFERVLQARLAALRGKG